MKTRYEISRTGYVYEHPATFESIEIDELLLDWCYTEKEAIKLLKIAIRTSEDFDPEYYGIARCFWTVCDEFSFWEKDESYSESGYFKRLYEYN